MLKPSGSQPTSTTSAPNMRSTRGAITAPPPWAASTQTFLPVRSRLSKRCPSSSSYCRTSFSTARTRGSLGESGVSSLASRSSSRSSASPSFWPSAPKILTPLSCDGLCDALIITPAAYGPAAVSSASAGVVTTPADAALTSAAISPCTIASRIHGDDSRPSSPNRTRRCEPSPSRCSRTPSAAPTRRSVSGSMGASPARPRRPSVPNWTEGVGVMSPCVEASRCARLRSCIRSAPCARGAARSAPGGAAD